MKKIIGTLLLLWVLTSIKAQTKSVQYSGSMQQMKQKNGLQASIMVDSLNLKNLYALGPVEYLQGEIIVWNGLPMVAAINKNKEPYLKKNVHPLKAIFLVYAKVDKWDTLHLSTPITSMQSLQKTIAYQAALKGIDTTQAFPFLLIGKIKSGVGHIMYAHLPILNSDSIAQAKYIQPIHQQFAQLLGFYSQHHQNIFTHSNNYLHVHYRLGNKYQAGHLDEVAFEETNSIELLLPNIH
jgi:acetolactate decarboxylase